MTGATVTRSGLCQQFVRWRKRKAIKDGVSVLVAPQSVPPDVQSELPAVQLSSLLDARMNLPLLSDAGMISGPYKLRPWMKCTDACKLLMR